MSLAETQGIGPADCALFQWRRYDEINGQWQRLLDSAPQVTLYHRPSWLELLSRAYRFSFWLATLNQDGEIAAGCVMARSKNPFVKRYIALPFSDTCAPLALNGVAATDLLHAIAAHAPSGSAYEIRGSRGPAPWQTVECFGEWRLDLARSLNSIEDGLAVNFRRNLHRSQQQGISIEHGADIGYLKRFYRLQLASRRGFGLPSQPWRFFKLVRELFSASGSFDVWIARCNGKDAASAVFLRDSDCVYYKWGARNGDDHSSANHLLFWRAIEEFAARAHTLDLGRTDFRNLGLTRFKRELGARALALPYAFYPNAPAEISPEVLTGRRRNLARVWRRMPIFVTRIVSRAAYRFLA
ncbi:MAG: GNAT family N-acetyltransferase [Candidatus Binataceae bacterium]